ncbi:MAG: hypothetical protein R3E08_00770 [Thiotrichaceae bacterium]
MGRECAERLPTTALNSPILSSSNSVVNNGVIENPVILHGANISGGTLVESNYRIGNV